MAALARYGAVDAFADHAEPVVAKRAWELLRGVPLYLPEGHPQHFLVGYGPMLFVLDSLFFKLFGGSIAVAKLAGFTTAALGAVLAFLFERSGSLWVCVIVHGVWNLGQLVFAGVLAAG